MAKDNLDDKIRTVLLYMEGAKDAKEISSVMGVSIRTARRWIRKYRIDGINGLALHKPGPAHGTGSISGRIRSRTYDSSKNTLRGEQDESSTSMICHATGEPCTGSSSQTVCWFESRQNPNHQRDSSEEMLIQCGRVIPSSSASQARERCMSQDSQTTVPGTA